MVCRIERLVEGAVGAVAGILRAVLQTRNDFSAQALDLWRGEGGMTGDVGKHVEQDGQVFGERFAGEAGRVDVAAEIEVCADAFERFVDGVKVAFLPAAQEC